MSRFGNETSIQAKTSINVPDYAMPAPINVTTEATAPIRGMVQNCIYIAYEINTQCEQVKGKIFGFEPCGENAKSREPECIEDDIKLLYSILESTYNTIQKVSGNLT